MRRVGAGLALAASMLVGVSPVLATLPETIWFKLCSGTESRWVAMPGQPAPPRDDGDRGLCAHATCPREQRIDRKARLPG